MIVSGLCLQCDCEWSLSSVVCSVIVSGLCLQCDCEWSLSTVWSTM